MKKFDKIFRVILGWIGGIFDIITFIVKYILGLVWIVYNFIRGKNTKKVFSKLNYNGVREIYWIIDEFKHYLKD